VEWERFADAEQVMEEAVRITEATRQLELATLVWNYQAELLMHRGNPRADLDAAERVLLRDLREAEQGGYLRSAAQSDCLLARLEMRRGRPEEALRYSTHAVELYRTRGDMPAMRTEEILFTHYRVLRARGRDAEAAPFLEEAYAVLEEKAGRLRDPERRASFLERVPLSREIAAAREAQEAEAREGPADAA
jgi:tetratricopeptide (TPR) repeat protein